MIFRVLFFWAVLSCQVGATPFCRDNEFKILHFETRYRADIYVLHAYIGSHDYQCPEHFFFWRDFLVHVG